MIFHKDHLLKPDQPNAGAETATLALARALRNIGCNVTIAAQLEQNFNSLLDAEGFYRDGIRYLDLTASYDTTDAFLRIAAQLEGARYTLIVASKAKALLESRQRPEIEQRIFISHEPSASGLGASPRLIGEVADYVTCISDAQRNLLVESGCEVEKIVVIPNGVDLELFQPGDISKRNFSQLIFVGALVVDKGLHLLVEAFHALRSRYPALRLDVYGSAALWGRENYLDPQQLERMVPGLTFHGAVSQVELAKAYQLAGLLIAPSIYFDAFNLCVAEALSTGCPAVGSIHGGMREVIEDGITGKIVTPSGSLELAAQLEPLVSKPELLQQYSRNALSKSRGRFNWVDTARRILELGVTDEQRKQSVFNQEEKVMNNQQARTNLPRIGFLTTFNQRCGLATYANYLTTALVNGSGLPLTVLAEVVSGSELLSADEPSVVRCWKRGSADFTELDQALATNCIQILHLNCHARFFDCQAFCKYLAEKRSAGLRIVAHVHNPFTVDQELQRLITVADKVIVHTVENSLELLANGAAPEQITVIEHGVIQQAGCSTSLNVSRAAARAKLGIASAEKALVCFGFIQPHKGIDQVVQALTQLRLKHPKIKLYLLGVPHQEDGQAVEYERNLRQLVETLQLQEHVIFFNSFVEESLVRDYLTAADAVVMNYQSNYYEASGAIATALGCSAAVVASTAPTFARLGDAVFHITTGFPLPLALDVVLSDQVLSSTLRTNAQRYAERNSWSNVASLVNKLYCSLAIEEVRYAPVAQVKTVGAAPSLRVLMKNRGNAQTQRGGDTEVMERVAQGLRELGVSVEIDLLGTQDPRNFDLVHLHNFATPELTEEHARAATAVGVPYVVTTMYEDRPAYFNQMLAHFRGLESYILAGQPRAKWESLMAGTKNVAAAPRFENSWTAKNSVGLIASGEREKCVLMRDYPEARLVESYPLGSETDLQPQSAELFIRETGFKDFVLCVGRLETRKNQLSLLKALEDSELTLVFVTGGFTYQPEYETLCRQFVRRGKTYFLNRLTSPQLASAYAAARVHALPSWYELPGIVSLEAARMGANIVVTDLGTAADYFGSEAYYCSPGDIDSIERAVLEAYNAPRSNILATRIAGFTWHGAAEKVLSIYQQALRISAEPSRSSYALPEWDVPRNEHEIIQQSFDNVSQEAKKATASVAELAESVYFSGNRAESIEPEHNDWAVITCEEGDRLMKEGRYGDAAERYREATEAAPTLPRPHRSAGVASLIQNDFKKAEMHFRQALRYDLNDVKSLAGLASCLWGLGDKERAFDLYCASAKRAPGDATLVFHLMNAAYALHRMDELEDSLLAYLELAPDDLKMKYCLAGCFFKQRKLALAASTLESLLSEDPQNVHALELREEIEKLRANRNNVAEGNPALSLRNLDLCVTELDRARSGRDWFVVIEIAGEVLANSKASREQQAYARVVRGEALAYTGELELADKELTLAADSRLYRSRGLTGRGAVAATRERWSEAEEHFTKALEDDASNDNAIAGLGICASQRGDMEKAWDCYARATQLNPENKRALLGIIQTGYPLKKLDGVEKVLNVYLEHHPADLDILYSLAGCYFAQGRRGEALSQLEKIRLFDPEHKLANELHTKISTDSDAGAGFN